MNLKSRDGSILVYVLVFFYFFLGWFHFNLMNLLSYLQEQNYLKQIDKQLKIEYQAINYLKNTDPQLAESIFIDEHLIKYECEQDVCTVYILGDINYSFVYDIIDE